MQIREGVVWRVMATPDQTWEILADYDEWPAWWGAVRSVELLDSGDSRGIGSVLRQRWRARLPIPLTVDLTMEQIARPSILAGRAGGDMLGTCTWELHAVADATLLRFAIDVTPARWWMRLPIPFAGRVAAAELRAVMETGRQGLARRLSVEVARVDPATKGATAET
jgi:hypothetical protein